MGRAPVLLMEFETIKSELRSYIRDNYKISHDDPDFSDQVHLYDYGYVDSFGSVQLKTFVESRFSVQFSQKDLTTVPLNTVEQMANFVVKRKNGQL
jgi:D-alanine--poly(phosphoribitol) ligase subunit 2